MGLSVVVCMVGEAVVGGKVVDALGGRVVVGGKVVDALGGKVVVGLGVVTTPPAGHQVPEQAKQFCSLWTHHPWSWCIWAWHQLRRKSGPHPH